MENNDFYEIHTDKEKQELYNKYIQQELDKREEETERKEVEKGKIKDLIENELLHNYCQAIDNQKVLESLAEALEFYLQELFSQFQTLVINENINKYICDFRLEWGKNEICGCCTRYKPLQANSLELGRYIQLRANILNVAGILEQYKPGIYQCYSTKIQTFDRFRIAPVYDSSIGI
jgi:hypothetical protein